MSFKIRGVEFRKTHLMKLVTILILPQVLEKLKDALTVLNIPGITTTELRVQNTCKKCHTCPKDNWHTMIQLEVAVSDDMVEQVTQCVLNTVGRTGKDSGEKILVTSLEEVIRVRTDEHGEHAL